WAQEFGATHAVDASKEDPVSAVQALSGTGGVDYAFEMVGTQKTMEQAFLATHRGGMCVVVGVSPAGTRLSVDPGMVLRQAGLAAALVFATTGLARAAPLQVEIILDMSGSMAYPLTATDRRPKVELARQAVLDLASRLPRDAQVGLTLYGHNPLSDKASSC